MDEQQIMQQAGRYSQYPDQYQEQQPQPQDLTPGQKEIMVSLFGKYYKQAGKAVQYLGTDNGQKVAGSVMVAALIALATHRANKK